MTGCAADEYEVVKQLGSGNFGVTNLMLHKPTGELVAVKSLKRGPKIDKNVFREVLNHRRLRHPNIIGFKGVYLTQDHLNIVMEYGGGGELFDLIQKAKRFSENDARYFFQQLICGVEYMHQEGITHRDIKLENTLLGGPRPATLVKICDLGYSKSPEAENSKCKSTVGTPAYLAPEVLDQGVYEGPGVDIWSCGVMLYVMLVGSYPFEDPNDRCGWRMHQACFLLKSDRPYHPMPFITISTPPERETSRYSVSATAACKAGHGDAWQACGTNFAADSPPMLGIAKWFMNVGNCMKRFKLPMSSTRTNFKKMMEKIKSLDYQLPAKLKLSEAVHDLLSKIFVRDPTKRATMAEIKQHPWYLHRLPLELTEGYQGFPRYPESVQSVEEIKRILEEARTVPEPAEEEDCQPPAKRKYTRRS